MANEERPKIKIPLGKLGLLLEVLSILSVIASFGVIIYFWEQLPEKMVSHWDFQGNPNGWSTKDFSLFFLPIVGAIVYITLTFLRAIPQHFNYVVVITAENAERIYKATLTFLGILKLQICALFAYISWMIVLGGISGNMDSSNMNGIWVFTGISLITVVVYIVKSRRLA